MVSTWEATVVMAAAETHWQREVILDWADLIFFSAQPLMRTNISLSVVSIKFKYSIAIFVVTLDTVCCQRRQSYHGTKIFCSCGARAAHRALVWDTFHKVFINSESKSCKKCCSNRETNDQHNFAHIITAWSLWYEEVCVVVVSLESWLQQRYCSQ